MTGTDLDTMGMDVSAGSQERLVDPVEKTAVLALWACDLDRAVRMLPASSPEQSGGRQAAGTLAKRQEE